MSSVSESVVSPQTPQRVSKHNGYVKVVAEGVFVAVHFEFINYLFKSKRTFATRMKVLVGILHVLSLSKKPSNYIFISIPSDKRKGKH